MTARPPAALAEENEPENKKQAWSPFRSARHAYGGLFWVLRQAPSVRFAVVAGVAGVAVAVVLRFSYLELAVLVVALATTLAVEILNTSIEMLCDELRPEPDAAIGRIKDVAAGGTAACEIGIAVLAVLLLGHLALAWLGR